MADLPSTGDDGWDSHLRLLIETVRKRQWLEALNLLNTMSKHALIELTLRKLNHGD